MIIEQPVIKNRQQLFITLYETAFPSVAIFIKKMGGNLEDAKDIFQDALLIHYEKTQQKEFYLEVDDKAYLIGICKHLWYKKFKEEKQKEANTRVELKQLDEAEPAVTNRIIQLIERSGKKCMELLQAFYFEKQSMKELAHLFGFSGERSATAQKYKCLEKIRETIKNNSLSKEDFYE